MAATTAAAKLTEAHRLAQLRVGRQTVAAMLATWRIFDLDNIDGTFDQWLRVVTPLVGAQRAKSTALAANYLTAFRAAELGLTAGEFQPVLAKPLPADRLTTSLLVTGPVAIRSALGRKVPAERAVAIAQRTTAGAALRHALNGGRETIVSTVRADRAAKGWARATSGKACAFCAMLASRGPVYGEDSADFQAHDHCSCTAEPVYRDGSWPAGSRRYQDMWRDATQGLSGGDARNAFRQALAGG